jgi:hypothetical protein
MNITEIKPIIEKHITEGEKVYHKWYKRTVKKAEEYRMMVTGEGMDKALRQFVRREDTDMFEQRTRITEHITSAILKSVIDVYRKVPNCNGIKRNLTHTSEKAKELIESKMRTFWGDRNFDEYTDAMFLNLNCIDPNAFVSFEWDEKNNVYPFEIYSKEVINYKKKNFYLDWLLAKIEYYDGEKVKYIFYQKDFNVIYEEVEKKTEGFDYFEHGGKIYRIEEVKHKLKDIQVVGVGYNEDLYTMTTFVAPYDACMPYLRKTIKVNSESDLTWALTAYPQQIRQMNPCDKCYNGTIQETGVKCKTCGGTGLIMPTSVQDVIGVKPPKAGETEMNLDNIIKYVYPPTEILNKQQEYIDSLIEKCKQVVFNTGIFDHQEIAVTATEKRLDTQNVNDSLFPYAKKNAYFWEFGVETIAEINNVLNGLKQAFIIPRDFKIETKTEIIQNIKTAKESGADSYVIDVMIDDLISILYIDDPISVKKFRTKKDFYPFAGKSQDEIMFIISSGLANDFDKKLYAVYGSIWGDIERKYTIAFYDKNRKEQYEIIKEFVTLEQNEPNFNQERITEEEQLS